jgi:hypothetical protein
VVIVCSHIDGSVLILRSVLDDWTVFVELERESSGRFPPQAKRKRPFRMGSKFNRFSGASASASYIEIEIPCGGRCGW